ELLYHADSLARQHGAMAISFMGTNANEAVPRLIELLADPNVETAHWSQKALSLIGASCVPALREAHRQQDGSALAAIEELLVYFGASAEQKEEDGFDWMQDDNTLVLFAWIGLRLRRKLESERRLAEELDQLEKSGKWRHGLPVASSSIWTRLKAFENRINQK